MLGRMQRRVGKLWILQQGNEDDCMVAQLHDHLLIPNYMGGQVIVQSRSLQPPRGISCSP